MPHVLPRVGRYARRCSILLGLVSLGATVLPAHAQTCTPFTDVPGNDPFCANIQWMFNRGVTLGCAPNQYCPANFVRRDQMAAFMNRLGDIVQSRITGSCAVGSYIRAIAADGSVICGVDNAGPANAFVQGGNAFGAPTTLGSNDAQPLEFRAGAARVMRYEPNPISPNVIGGSPANSVTQGVRGATIAGGGLPQGNTDPEFNLEAPNRITDAYGTIGGGYANQAGDGVGNTSDRGFATVGGGVLNVASGTGSTIGGGFQNSAPAPYGVVAAGFSNGVSGPYAVVGGGNLNSAEGSWSMVPGGRQNATLGDYSFAAGRRAKANSDGCFVWADNTDLDFICTQPNAFIVRATGGVFIRTSLALDGVILPAGGSAWSPVSDRSGKDNVVPVDPRQVLDRLVEVPIATWNYVSQAPAIRHMGPMAQDLHAAFGLGESDRHISTIDADGIALAAIQGLNAKLEATLARRARDLETDRAARTMQAQQIEALTRLVERLEQRLLAAPELQK